MYKQLLRDLILVRPIKEELKTASGIVLLENMQDTKKSSVRGKVEQVSPNVTEIEKGDIVRYNDYSGIEAEDGCILLKEEHVICIIKPTESQNA